MSSNECPKETSTRFFNNLCLTRDIVALPKHGEESRVDYNTKRAQACQPACDKLGKGYTATGGVAGLGGKKNKDGREMLSCVCAKPVQ